MFGTPGQFTEKERKWNMMWDKWMEGTIESPYAELIEYDEEINNGGHYQYFFNVAVLGGSPESIEMIIELLPTPLNDNLKKAFDAFSSQEDDCDDSNFDLFRECDEFFYENETLLLEALQAYPDELS